MRLLKNIVIALATLVVAFVVVGFILPREVAVSRDIAINAPPETVFTYVNDLKKFNDWSPWARRDPAMKQTYTGPQAGIGQMVAWQSDKDNVGSGTQKIIASTPPSHVETVLDFGDMGSATASFDLEGFDGGTRITWGFKTDLGNNPFMRWMGLMFDGWIGKDYEEGLANLKELAERPAAH